MPAKRKRSTPVTKKIPKGAVAKKKRLKYPPCVDAALKKLVEPSLQSKGIFRKKFTLKFQQLFIEKLIEHRGLSRLAAQYIPVSLTMIYTYRNPDDPNYSEEFAKAWKAAVDFTTEQLEEEAYRRAFVGVEETVLHQGLATGYSKIKHSDTLTIFLLKGRKPDVYRDITDVNIGNKDGEPFKTQIVLPEDFPGGKQ